MKLTVIRNACGDPYLVRLSFFELLGFSLKLHIILRGDEDRELHDHPWDFATLMLLGGYFEERFTGGRNDAGEPITGKAWIAPGTFRLCRAPYAHRLELPIESYAVLTQCIYKPAVTLVFMWPQKREWGFYTAKGWTRHSDYLAGKEC